MRICDRKIRAKFRFQINNKKKKSLLVFSDVYLLTYIYRRLWKIFRQPVKKEVFFNAFKFVCFSHTNTFEVLHNMWQLVIKKKSLVYFQLRIRYQKKKSYPYIINFQGHIKHIYMYTYIAKIKFYTFYFFFFHVQNTRQPACFYIQINNSQQCFSFIFFTCTHEETLMIEIV